MSQGLSSTLAFVINPSVNNPVLSTSNGTQKEDQLFIGPLISVGDQWPNKEYFWTDQEQHGHPLFGLVIQSCVSNELPEYMILVLEHMTEPLISSLVWSDEVTIASLLHRVHI